MITRPLGRALHAFMPNQLVSFGFCLMTPGENRNFYVLILKSDHCGYVCPTPCADANEDTVADELMRWFTTFGTVRQWVSEKGSHFKN